MTFTILLLLSGLTLSAVAIYYSVIGLTSIFSAAFWPIVVMGTTLEVSKLVAASWLKSYWTQIPRMMKLYMTTAVIVLMIITSMGIFGFLSKAHSDQTLVSGDVQSKIAIYDEKIKTAKDNIDANRKALKQMDEAVDQVMGRSSDEKGAEKAVAIRRGQQKERTRLQSEITAEQKVIASLSEERAPIAAEVRKVEAEVGPIKYIAAFIYGDNPDANILEKAVTWVIVIIVAVFDPLAVLMLLGAQMTLQWRREQLEGTPKETTEVITPEPVVVPTVVAANDDIDVVAEANDKIAEIEKEEPEWASYLQSEPSPKIEEISPRDLDLNEAAKEEKVNSPEFDVDQHVKSYAKEESDIVEQVGLEQWNKMIEEAEREVQKEKDAKRIWKDGHPNETIKETLIKKELGIIEELPWEVPQTVVKQERIKPDLTEVIEPESAESKKKTTYIVKENNQQVLKTKD